MHKNSKDNPWEVVQATGRVTFIEKSKGRGGRFYIRFDEDGMAQRIADKLNQLEAKIEKLKGK